MEYQVFMKLRHVYRNIKIKHAIHVRMDWLKFYLIQMKDNETMCIKRKGV